MFVFRPAGTASASGAVVVGPAGAAGSVGASGPEDVPLLPPEPFFWWPAFLSGGSHGGQFGRAPALPADMATTSTATAAAALSRTSRMRVKCLEPPSQRVKHRHEQESTLSEVTNRDRESRSLPIPKVGSDRRGCDLCAGCRPPSEEHPRRPEHPDRRA